MNLTYEAIIVPESIFLCFPYQAIAAVSMSLIGKFVSICRVLCFSLYRVLRVFIEVRIAEDIQGFLAVVFLVHFLLMLNNAMPEEYALISV